MCACCVHVHAHSAGVARVRKHAERVVVSINLRASKGVCMCTHIHARIADMARVYGHAEGVFFSINPGDARVRVGTDAGGHMVTGML